MDVDIRGLHLLAALPDEEMAAVSRLLRVRRFGRGDRVPRAGEPPLGVMLLFEGRLRVIAVTLGGREVTMRRHCAGSVAGLDCLLPAAGRHGAVEVVAETDGALAHIPAERVLAVMPELPGLSRALLTEAVRQLLDAEEFARRTASTSVLGRVAAALLELSLPPEGAAVHREHLASRAVASRESVSRALHRLAAEGRLEVRGKAVRIVDEMALRRLATPGEPIPCYEADGPQVRPGICPGDDPTVRLRARAHAPEAARRL
jgi:CRP/FNR family transcriptional regulator